MVGSSKTLTEKQQAAGWRVVKFGDICQEVKATCKDPEADGLEHYIGLEHLDSGSLRIKRRGSIAEDSPSFTRRFSAGQLLFGKRRCYLKKAAVANFDGICSGDIIVMAPKGNQIVPELLPFIVQSDAFWNWAEQTSSGSLSPRTKFKSLADWEFPLPPVERQKELLSLMRKASGSVHTAEEFVHSCFKTKEHLANRLILQSNWYSELFESKAPTLLDGWKYTHLGSALTSVQYGLSEAAGDSGEYPILRMMNMENGYVVENDLKYLDLPKEQAAKFLLDSGDIVFNRTNSMELVGRTGIYKLSGQHVFASYLLRVKVDESVVSPEFINYYLNLPLIQYRLKAYATPGVSQANINPASLKSIPLLLPPKDQAQKIVDTLAEFDRTIEQANSHLNELRITTSQVINNYLQLG